MIGTEDATPLTYSIALAPDRFVQLDDVVVCERTLPDGETVTVAGVVTQIRASHEGTRFASDVFLVEDAVLPAQTTEVLGSCGVPIVVGVHLHADGNAFCAWPYRHGEPNDPVVLGGTHYIVSCRPGRGTRPTEGDIARWMQWARCEEPPRD